MLVCRAYPLALVPKASLSATLLGPGYILQLLTLVSVSSLNIPTFPLGIPHMLHLGRLLARERLQGPA